MLPSFSLNPLLKPTITFCQKIRNTAYVGRKFVRSQLSGWDVLKSCRLNKGLGFTIEERQRLGIHGMFPSGYRTQDQQCQININFIRRYKNNLNKYMYLTGLRDTNEKLFFRLLQEHTEELMPIVYTPTVGLACQTYGLLYKTGHGLYISKHDRGHVADVLANWPENDIKAVCITDGERILGLGDLGAFGMGIPVGKLSLYTALGGINPNNLLPICMDVGTNNEELLTDMIYIGCREKRMMGNEYYDFVDEVMRALVQRYGCNCLIQFEDFSNVNAFYFLERYKEKYCIFNDDIQGTAAAVVAGLLSTERITGIPLEAHQTILFFGAGGANVGIAELICKKMKHAGIPVAEVHKRIWMMDVDGLITTSREELDPHRAPFAKVHEPTKDLSALVKELKPSVLIGASTISGSFTPQILRIMAANHRRPIIFALSNPTDKAECTAQEAYDHTEGRVVFASGSPFPPVIHEGLQFHTGQGNNAYIFPGVALGVIAVGIHYVTDELFLIAAQCVADQLTDEEVAQGRTYPNLSTLRKVSLEIATRVSEYAYCKGFATHYPEPEDIKEYIRKQLYSVCYDDFTIKPWAFPKLDEHIHVKPLDESYVQKVGVEEKSDMPIIPTPKE